MKTKASIEQLILMGKFKDVCKFLKDCESKYIYVKDLIDALNLEEQKSIYIN